MAEGEGTKLQSGAGAVDARLSRVAAKLFQEKNGKRKGREILRISLALLLRFMCLRPIHVCITCITLFNKDTPTRSRWKIRLRRQEYITFWILRNNCQVPNPRE